MADRQVPPVGGLLRPQNRGSDVSASGTRKESSDNPASGNGGTSRTIPAATESQAAQSKPTKRSGKELWKIVRIAAGLQARDDVQEAKAKRALPLSAAVKMKRKVRRLRKRKQLDKTLFIHPQAPYKLGWDVFIGVLIIYSVISLPFRIGLNIEASEANTILDRIFDGLFVVDMLLNFFTGYFTEQVLVTDRRKIAKKYLKTWFLVDFSSTFPFDVLFSGYELGDANALRSFKLIKAARLIRLIRLLKLLRVLRLRKYSDSIQTLPISMTAVNLFSLLCKILFMAHIFSCFWVFAASLEDGNNWLELMDPNQRSVTNQYIMSFYWATYTMLTIGYGNIRPTNDTERIYAIGTQLIGAISFGFIIATVTVIVETMDSRATERKNKIDEIKFFMDSYSLPKALKKKVLQHYQFHFSRNLELPDRQILNGMQQHLRDTLILNIHRPLISSIEMFGNVDRSAIAALIPLLRPFQATPEHTLLRFGEVPEEVYIVSKGAVKVITIYNHRRINCALLTDGEVIGIGSCLECEPVSVSYKTTAATELYAIAKSDLIRICQLYPSCQQELLKYEARRDAALACAAVHDTATLGEQEWARYVMVKGNKFVRLDDLDRSLVPQLNTVRRRQSAFGINIAAELLKRNSDAKEPTAPGISAGDSGGAQVGFYEDNGEEDRLLRKKWLIHPKSSLKMKWDLGMGVLTLATLLVIPYRLAFDAQAYQEDIVFDMIVNAFFVVDMIACFRTAYYNPINDVLVVDTKEIGKRYLRSWFAPDLVSVIPVDQIVALSMQGDESGIIASAGLRSLKLIRILRLFRLLKLVRLMKLRKHMGELDQFLMVHPSIIRATTLLLQLSFVAHIFGCIWFLTSNEPAEGEETWWSALGIPLEDHLTLYIASIYWVTTTMSTVGYGDIIPVNDNERLVCIALMLAGATMFGYVISSIGNLVTNLMLSDPRFSSKTSLVAEYLAEQEIPKKIREDAKNHHEYLTSHRVLFNQEVLSLLPLSLRRDVLITVNSQMISQVSIFHNQDQAFIIRVLTSMKVEYFQPGDIICEQTIVANSLLFLVDGSIQLEFPRFQRGRVTTLAPGDMLGFESFLSGDPHPYTARAQSKCALLSIAKTQIGKLHSDSRVMSKQLIDILGRAIAAQYSRHHVPQNSPGSKGLSTRGSDGAKSTLSLFRPESRISLSERKYSSSSKVASHRTSPEHKASSKVHPAGSHSPFLRSTSTLRRSSLESLATIYRKW